MRQHRRTRPLTAVVLALGLVAAACGSSGDGKSTDATGTTAPAGTGDATNTTVGTGVPAGVKTGGTATVFKNADLRSFDPAAAETSITTGGPAIALVYDRLIQYSPDGLVPRLATSVKPNADLTEYTISLRPKVTFSDGTPLDAAAIKFNWDRYNTIKGSTCKAPLALFKTWDVVDSATLKVTLGQPIGEPFYYAMADCLGIIASPTAIQAAADKYGTTTATTVGAGPYVLKEWVAGDHQTFTRNTKYWDSPRPYIETIIEKPVPDDIQRADAFISGAGQAGDWVFPTLGYGKVQSAGLKCLTIQTYGGGGVVLNLKKAPFNDVRMRQAFQLATNPTDLSVKATNGAAQPASTIFPKDSKFYDPTAAVQPAENLQAAQKLVDAYIAEKGPVPTINFLTSPSLAPWPEIATQQWSRLKGVTINYNNIPITDFVGQRAAGNFDILVGADIGVHPDDGTTNNMYQNMITGGTANYGGFSDAEVDRLLNQARGSSDVALQKKNYNHVGNIVLSQATSIFFYRAPLANCYSKSVKGLTLFGQGLRDWTNAWLDS